jgi:hypothetical protein
MALYNLEEKVECERAEVVKRLIVPGCQEVLE